MALHFFYIRAQQPEREQEALNQFCLYHEAITIEKEWVHDGAASFWSVCVTTSGEALGSNAARGGRSFATRSQSTSAKSTSTKLTTAKIDYLEVLTGEQFERFAALRQFRKSLASAAGVPPYAVFTNAQLAAVVTTDAKTLEALGKIAGMGTVRLEKFGRPLLEFLRESP